MEDNLVPPYSITPSIIELIAGIGESLGILQMSENNERIVRLRRENNIKSIQASLQIENNTLTIDQVTAVISGKRVMGHPREIKEVLNANELYTIMEIFNPHDIHDFLRAHAVLMDGLIESAGEFRMGSVGIVKGDEVLHIAPPAEQVGFLMKALFEWLGKSEEHPLIKSSVFHYEVEFIHPFSDGNGRMGRLWQTILLSKWRETFLYLPVESVIRDRQQEYYDVLAQSDNRGDSTAFIEFMLDSILMTIREIGNDQVTVQVSDQVKSLMLGLREKKPLSALEIMVQLGLSHRTNFRNNYLHPALEEGLIEMTVPGKPNSSLQKYRLTAQGKRYLMGIGYD